MNCCINCFNDNYLKSYIKKEGAIAQCNYCFSVDVKCINEIQLYDMFKNIFSFYCRNEKNTFGTRKKNLPQARTLIALMQHDWDLFNSMLLSNTVLGELVYNIFKGDSNCNVLYSDILSDIWFKESELYYGYFTKNDWYNFCSSIKHEYRFFHNRSDIIEFDLEETFTYKTFQYAESRIDKSTILYRGRNGYSLDNNKQKKPYKQKNMGIPDINIISTGRANPYGINYLYTADDISTVLSEIRASNESIVTIAIIEVQKQLRIVDLTDIYQIESPFQLYNSQEELQSIEILKVFSEELSKPVSLKYSPIDYIPTQFICELIRSEGYDGIKFKSSLSEGNNVVLFDMNKIRIRDVKLNKVKKISYEYEEYLIEE